MEHVPLEAATLLVTGAKGFLGSHIVRLARENGWGKVVAACRRAEAPQDLQLDMLNAESIDRALDIVKPSHIVHCAAYGVSFSEQDLQTAMEVNVHGSLLLLSRAIKSGVKKFVHIGSCFEYGSHANPITENAELRPVSVYGATKAAASILMMQQARSSKIEFTLARPFGIWGADEAPYRLVPQIIDACLRRKKLKLTGCEQVRDLLYVEDVADMVLKLALASGASRPQVIVNVASGKPVLLKDFVVSVARIFDCESLIQFGALEYRPSEMMCLVADVSSLRRSIGEIPMTSVDEGVRRILQSRTAL